MARSRATLNSEGSPRTVHPFSIMLLIKFFEKFKQVLSVSKNTFGKVQAYEAPHRNPLRAAECGPRG